MRPEENRQANSVVVPSRQNGGGLQPSPRQSSQDAATDVVRSQIDSIYSHDDNLTTAVPTPASEPDDNQAAAAIESEPTSGPAVQPGPGAVDAATSTTSAYDRTHDEQQHQVQTKAWQRYHTAWQSYYQQYYERYYVGQVSAAKKSLEHDAHVRPIDETISSDEALYDLRSKLRNQIDERAKKIRKSRHFVPIIAGVMVMLVFLFLQYNRILISNAVAYMQPGNLDPATLIVDPNSSNSVSAETRLIVPKISVDVPIIWDANAASLDSLNAAMDKGVAWFNMQGASAKPGEKGNFVLSGHSSNDWLDGGDYKFIFAPLERMKEGDTIYVNYNSTRYTYTVTHMQVVKPTDVQALQLGTDKPYLTLITCTPLGTALNRLLVFADQVSPDPNEASAQTNSESSSSDASKMPSNSPTFFERIFGTGNSN